MKKTFKFAVVVALILVASVAIFAGCAQKLDPNMRIGKTAPTSFETKPVDKNMSAFEMLAIGVENYYNADYAITAYQGGVETKVLGIGVNQYVESTKIREGKGDPSGNNATGATYFNDSKGKGAAKLYEKMVISPSEIKYKNAASGVSQKKDGTWTAKKWNAVEKNFADVQDFAKKKASNPTVLWMYDLQKDYIKEATTPELKDGVYKFKIVFDPVECTKNYINTMKAQLEVNAGMPVQELVFKALSFDVELWENGALKRIKIVESYKMKLDISIGLLDSVVTMNADNQFSYDKNEKGYALQDHLAAF